MEAVTKPARTPTGYSRYPRRALPPPKKSWFHGRFLAPSQPTLMRPVQYQCQPERVPARYFGAGVLSGGGRAPPDSQTASSAQTESIIRISAASAQSASAPARRPAIQRSQQIISQTHPYTTAGALPCD